MRMSEWTPEVIRFMEDAERKTSYFSHIASIVRDHTASGARIADVGCGMGQLAFALADHASSVDAVDLSERAIGYVNGRVQRTNCENVHGVLESMFDWEPSKPYDAMAFCLSASIPDALRIGLERCRGTLIIVNKIQSKMDANRQRSGLQTAERDRRPLVYNFEETLLDLARQGLCFEGREISIDYGQPFRSLDDARLYYSLFRTRSFPDGATDQQILSQLDRTEDPEFPLYLPVRRHLAVYVIDASRQRA